jgi:hypothetical protein
MPSTFELGGAVAVKEIFAAYARTSEANRLGMQLMPLTEVDETKLIYERHDLLRGIQAARGLGGATQPVAMPGFSTFSMEPGYYGDHHLLTEQDLVNRRQVGDWHAFDSQGSLTDKAARNLERRFADRIEKNTFDVILTGLYEGQDEQGRLKTADVYAIQRATPGTLFTDLANSTPLRFLRDTIATAELSVSVNFRAGEMLMNRVTLNTILNNANAADLGGKRFDVGQTLNSVAELNDILIANDLPKVRVYDEGFYPTAGGFQRFIPNGRIALLGKRTDGETVGEYRLTRYAQNGGGKGYWVNVDDMTSGPGSDPPKVIVKAGHNGGPVIYYPEAVLSITAF